MLPVPVPYTLPPHARKRRAPERTARPGGGAAAQVIRLFGRLKALKKILAALLSSIVPVANSFILVFIISSICAGPGPVSP